MSMIAFRKAEPKTGQGTGAGMALSWRGPASISPMPYTLYPVGNDAGLSFPFVLRVFRLGTLNKAMPVERGLGNDPPRQLRASKAVEEYTGLLIAGIL